MPVDHYENFPVASILLPKYLRRPVEVIYRFARQADDFADEGDAPDETRLAQLDGFRAELNRIAAAEAPQTPLFSELQKIIAEHELPIQLLHDLLDAFTQDVTKKRYANFDEVLDYCRRSANPVGRLLLHLYQDATPRNLEYSDAICTALQLINFWQDIAKDYAINRIYLPQDDMAKFSVTEQHIAGRNADARWRDLLRFETDRASELLRAGLPLGSILTGRIGLEMRMIIAGGDRILHKLRAANFDVFDRRPVLRAHDWVIMLFNSAPFQRL
ncbi:MAG: squalene synthase HpnC [Gallionellaceae bacterium]|jgi:phytoene synthase|nr:squalene synthase HpnC [Gallionellaceae bacterium]